MKKIWWHGTTNKKKVNSILKNGFNEGTWFAEHLENALEFGGKYVFAVIISFPKKRTWDWQVCCSNRISSDRILWIEEFKIKRSNENKKLIKDFFNPPPHSAEIIEKL